MDSQVFLALHLSSAAGSHQRDFHIVKSSLAEITQGQTGRPCAAGLPAFQGFAG